jgi:hypothetical protein
LWVTQLSFGFVKLDADFLNYSLLFFAVNVILCSGFVKLILFRLEFALDIVNSLIEFVDALKVAITISEKFIWQEIDSIIELMIILGMLFFLYLILVFESINLCSEC